MPSVPKRKGRPWESSAPGFYRTGKSDERYRSPRWRNDVRPRILRRDPICVYCKRIGIITESTTVDHIIPVALGADFWDESNLQGLCLSCHQSKSAKEGNKRRSS